MGVKCSVYLDKNSKTKSARRPVKNFLTVFIVAIFALFLGAQGSAFSLSSGQNNSSHTAQAGTMGILCGPKDQVMMDAPFGWESSTRFYPVSDGANRKWTLDEAYGNGLKYPIYTGEGEGGMFVRGTEKDRGKGIGNWDEQLSRFESVRTSQDCLISVFATEAFANVPTMFTGMMTTFIQNVSTMVFDSSIICKSATDANQGNCFNLLKAIGGTSDTINPDGTLNSNSGMLGKLTNGVYLPMLVLVVMAAGMYVLYIGLVKRKFREALFATIWVLLSAILGLTFLYKPTMLAKAPMALSNTVAGCIIGGYNGQNCMTSDTAKPTPPTSATDTPSSKVVCSSDAATSSPDENMSLVMNSMSCSIWKAFMLEAYSEGNFGRSFEQMDTANPEIKKVIKKAGLKPEDFCVSLRSSKSVDDQGSTLEMDGTADKICNVVAYQMFLNTTAKDTSGVGTTFNDGKPWNKDWYKVALVAANDDSMWGHWSIGMSESMRKIFMTIITFITVVGGGAVIVVISVFAFIYYLAALLLMAMAPLFFLLGVHPGRGKKLLLGYGESVLENVFKYMASAMFLIITIGIYDAVLGSMTNMGLTLVFVIILSFALFLYRKELVNLIGKVNMGGQRLTNQIEKTMAPRMQRMANATAGGAVGAAWAGGSIKPNELIKNARFGATQGIKSDLRRDRNSLIGGTIAQYDRFGADNKRDLNAKASDYQDKAKIANQALVDEKDRNETITKEAAASSTQLQDAQINAKEVINKTNEANQVKADVVLNAEGLDPMFRKMQDLTNQLATMRIMRGMAEASGDYAEMDRLDLQINATEGRRDSIMARFDADTLDANVNAYDRSLELAMRARGITDVNASDADVERVFTNLANSRDAYIDKVEALNNSNLRVQQLDNERIRNTNIGTKLRDTHTDLRGGEWMSKKKIDALEQQELEKAAAIEPKEAPENNAYLLAHADMPLIKDFKFYNYEQPKPSSQTPDRNWEAHANNAKQPADSANDGAANDTLPDVMKEVPKVTMPEAPASPTPEDNGGPNVDNNGNNARKPGADNQPNPSNQLPDRNWDARGNNAKQPADSANDGAANDALPDVMTEAPRVTMPEAPASPTPEVEKFASPIEPSNQTGETAKTVEIDQKPAAGGLPIPGAPTPQAAPKAATEAPITPVAPERPANNVEKTVPREQDYRKIEDSYAKEARANIVSGEQNAEKAAKEHQERMRGIEADIERERKESQERIAGMSGGLPLPGKTPKVSNPTVDFTEDVKRRERELQDAKDEANKAENAARKAASENTAAEQKHSERLKEIAKESQAKARESAQRIDRTVELPQRDAPQVDFSQDEARRRDEIKEAQSQAQQAGAASNSANAANVEAEKRHAERLKDIGNSATSPSKPQASTQWQNTPSNREKTLRGLKPQEPQAPQKRNATNLFGNNNGDDSE